MAERALIDEIARRIERERGHSGGHIPERVALVWYGYLAGLIEWGMISVAEHAELSNLLPQIADNPVMAVLLGREE